MKIMDECIKRLDSCTEKTRKNGLSREEMEVEIFFVNKKNEELKIIEIDGCFVIDNLHKRCDFMVQHGIVNYYIELKSSGWGKAVMQIAASINMLNKKYFGNKKCQPIIVLANQTPRQKIIKLAREELDKLVGPGICEPLKIQNSPYDLPLS